MSRVNAHSVMELLIWHGLWCDLFDSLASGYANVFRVILLIVIFSHCRLYYLERQMSVFKCHFFSECSLISREFVIVQKYLSSICLISPQRIVHSGRARIKFRHEKPISHNSSTWSISIFHNASIQPKSMFDQKKFCGFQRTIFP